MSQPTDRRTTRLDRRPSRRKFLAKSVGSAASLGAVAFGMPTLLRAKDLNGKLNIAIIGCGGRGGANLQGVASENIVALCDVNENGINQWKDKYPHARRIADFRKLYDHASEFDAVVVSTPEHTHAFATMPALRLGKHVYCEKPLTHSVYESRLVRETAAKAGVATQMGTQIHAGDNYRRVVELIRAGAIGPVREAHVWVGRTWGRMETEAEAKQHGDIVFVKERPAGSSPVPPGVDWDLWLGPAPARPFHEVYLPGPKWYRWWDFGNGTMSDLGSHWNDLPFWALDLKAPTTIEANGPAPHPEIAPATMSAKYEFPARGEMPAVAMTWYQGQMKPPQWMDKSIPQWDSGVLFVGDKGMLLSDYGKHVLLPEDKFKEFKRPEPTIPASIGHYAEWIHAAKTGAPTTCNFEYAGWLTESNHLGNVAYRVGKKIEWNAEKMEATNCPDAAPLIRREYRAGWTL